VCPGKMKCLAYRLRMSEAVNRCCERHLVATVEVEFQTRGVSSSKEIIASLAYLTLRKRKTHH
jgi:hypothetical protein